MSSDLLSDCMGIGRVEETRETPVDLTVNSLETQMCISTFWWNLFSVVSQLSNAEENLKR